MKSKFDSKYLLVVLSAIIFLGFGSTAQADLVTSAGDFPDATVIDFSEFNGPWLITAGPVQIGTPVARDIEWFSTYASSAIGSGTYGLDGNGSWTSGRNGYTGLNTSSGAMTYQFNDLPVAGVGGFMNYAVPGYGNAIIQALDQAGEVLESYDLVALAPISTPGETDAGAFRGIVRAQADIYALRVSNAFDVLDDFSFTGTSLEAGVARFRVTKTYTDGSTDPVTVTLTCNSGLPLVQDFTLTGDDDGVTFVVTDIPEAGATCTVTESGGPDGYTPILNGGAGCEFTSVSTGYYICSIVNAANPGEFTVTKTWEVSEDGAGDEVIEVAEVWVVCDREIIGGEIRGEGDFPVGVEELWGIYGAIPGDGFLTAIVDTSNGPAQCTAFEGTEFGFDEFEGFQSGVEISSDCPPAFDDEGFFTNPSSWTTVEAGGEEGCSITNTVFFEGIPSLNQYGLAIMALLMLGLGMVGFRRFV